MIGRLLQHALCGLEVSETKVPGVDPADDPGLASSTLPGGDKFKGLAGGGAISYWIRWTAPNDVASLGDYTAGGNAHVLDAPGGTNILPITAVPFSIQLSYPDPL